MPIARDDLGRDRLGREAELFRDVRFDPRVDIGEGADRPGNLAGRDLLACRDKPLAGGRPVRLLVAIFIVALSLQGLHLVAPITPTNLLLVIPSLIAPG